ncbi:MAG: hypothetical protein D6814_08970 [Calditrichaeota bacterium]|nr:MAG: hypothetical protein D6814_08970 [Calditrichota bacterium]
MNIHPRRLKSLLFLAISKADLYPQIIYWTQGVSMRPLQACLAGMEDLQANLDLLYMKISCVAPRGLGPREAKDWLAKSMAAPNLLLRVYPDIKKP